MCPWTENGADRSKSTQEVCRAHETMKRVGQHQMDSSENPQNDVEAKTVEFFFLLQLEDPTRYQFLNILTLNKWIINRRSGRQQVKQNVPFRRNCGLDNFVWKSSERDKESCDLSEDVKE